MGELVVAVRQGKPVFLQDVATVVDGALPPARYVWHGVAGQDAAEFPAVTLSVTKKPGENAIDVADAVMQRIESLKNTVIPADVQVAQTRNYGASANDKAKKLIQKLLFATASVVALVFIALGRREAAIVGTAVVLTLAATLFASWAWGFTLNRVSLFALIFSIGILVDDAIVVVENIHRHQQLYPGRTLTQIIPGAVDEVGGPTILATLDGDRRAAADGLRLRPDGPVHEPDSDQRQHGHADFARHCVQRDALAGAAVDEGHTATGSRRRGCGRTQRSPTAWRPDSRRCSSASSALCSTTGGGGATAACWAWVSPC